MAAANSAAGTYNANNAQVNLGELVEPADGSPPYYPLLEGSIALGNGDPAHCLSIDQLGNARPNPSGSNCDLGAVESSIVANSPTLDMTMTVGQNSEQDPDGNAYPYTHCHRDANCYSDRHAWGSLRQFWIWGEWAIPRKP